MCACCDVLRRVNWLYDIQFVIRGSWQQFINWVDCCARKLNVCVLISDAVLLCLFFVLQRSLPSPLSLNLFLPPTLEVPIVNPARSNSLCSRCAFKRTFPAARHRPNPRPRQGCPPIAGARGTRLGRPRARSRRARPLAVEPRRPPRLPVAAAARTACASAPGRRHRLCSHDVPTGRALLRLDLRKRASAGAREEGALGGECSSAGSLPYRRSCLTHPPRRCRCAPWPRSRNPSTSSRPPRRRGRDPSRQLQDSVLWCTMEASRLVLYTCASPLSVRGFPWFWRQNLWWDSIDLSSMSQIVILMCYRMVAFSYVTRVKMCSYVWWYNDPK